MPHLLIIGGSDAGVSATLRAREVNPTFDVTTLVADDFPNYSICGLPFFISGEVPDWRRLAHRTVEELRASGATFRLRHRATAVDIATREVIIDTDNGTEVMRYDRLVIATGAEPVWPPIAGVDSRAVFFLHTMEDSFRLERQIEAEHPQSIVIVGAGYIGLEMADALARRGIEITLAGRASSVLPTVDESLGQIVEEELSRHGVRWATRVTVENILRDANRLRVTGTGGFECDADLVLIAVGVQPTTGLSTYGGD